jgi:ankyrin repeat protein
VEELLGSQVEPDAAGPDRETPLCAAIHGGHEEVLEALLAAGAEPSEDAVNTALRYGRREMLITLLEGGANPDTRNAWSTRSLLEMAADSGDAKMVQLLLKHGADPTEAPEATFMTSPALHIALLQKRTEIALILLRHGADPFIRSQGWTAAELAVETGQDEVVSAIRKIQERRGDEHEAG